MTAKSEPRPAATIILLRDASAGPEVFMLQRTRGAVFLPGAYVFPGGGIDAADRDPRAARRVTGLTDEQASAKLGFASGGLAYWIAAARECFEEAGILLAVDRAGAPVAPRRVEAIEHWRAPLNAGERSFTDLLEAEGLFVPADEIVYFSHWITAAGRPRRFNTRFFVARAPLGQDGAHDASETVHSVWVSPREALARRAGTKSMLTVALPLGHTHGWGICGKYLTRELARLAPVRLLTDAFDAESIGDDLEYSVLQGLALDREARAEECRVKRHVAAHHRARGGVADHLAEAEILEIVARIGLGHVTRCPFRPPRRPVAARRWRGRSPRCAWPSRRAAARPCGPQP